MGGRALQHAATLIDGLHVTFTSHAQFVGDLIVFTTGLLLIVLLLVLTLRAAKLPGTPGANIIFALTGLLWSAGGLFYTAFLASGASSQSRTAQVALAIQFSGAACFPIPVLAIWRSYARSAWQKQAARVLVILACISTASIAALLWSSPIFGTSFLASIALKRAIAYNAAFLLTVGALASLRRDSVPRAIYFSSMAMVLAICGAAIIHYRLPADGNAVAHLGFAGSHLILLVVLCAFFLFARFRYADIFTRYGVRILLAGTWASLIALIAQSSFLLHLARHSPSPPAVHVFGVILVANALLLSFTFVDDRISAMVNRWLFRTPDYRAGTRQLGNRLGSLQVESEIMAAVEHSVRGLLQLSGAHLMPIEGLPVQHWPPGILEGEIVELDCSDPLRTKLPLPNAEVLAPVTSGGRVTHVLLASPGSARPSLVTHDINYLRTATAQCGNRLDALHREREAVENQSREALLLQQVTDAELRALRAQINPHFLFNSLNTIADLIARDPPRAEEMTLRLASVFRHVLAHSSRSLIAIRDEIEFLRTYLHIEEARFGDRLHVEIEVAPEVAGDAIPSLILQPLVENALKHGLAPKLGLGNLWISAHIRGNQVSLCVEDDGIGARVARVDDAQGLGLTNVAQRLRTLYQDAASLKLEPREGGGIRASILIPRGKSGSPA